MTGWRVCEQGEQPWDGRTPFCGEPCRACLVVAEVELNKLNPFTTDPRNLASWHEIIGVLAGDEFDQ